MIRRMFVLAGLALLVFAPAAHAQYGTPGMSVSDSTVSSGDTVLVTVTCDVPDGTNIVAYLDGAIVGSTLADNGTGIIGFVVNASNGTHVISNSCNDAVISITVGAGGAVAGPGALPRTGSDNSLPLAKVAIVLIAAGGLMLVATRKHTKTKQTVNA